MSEFLSNYDDIGSVYEFSFLADDVWKKDEVFGLFATRVTRMIALEVGVPVEQIGWGKWGARLYPKESDSLPTLKEWVKLIKSHPTFKALEEVCKLATYRKEGSESQEDIFDYLDSYDEANEYLIVSEIKKEAKEGLSKQDYKKFLFAIKK